MQQPQRAMSLEEYLLLDNNSQERYEYIDGYPRKMPVGTGNHSDLIANMFIEIRTALGKKTPCRAYSEDRRVKVANNTYVYPDVVVSCNVADHGQATTIEEPHLVVEVVSPNSTEVYDRTQKMRAYQQTPSIQEIIFINQSVQSVEVFRRQDRGSRWSYQQYWQGETVQLESIDVEVAVDSIYDGVAIPIEVEGAEYQVYLCNRGADQPALL